MFLLQFSSVKNDKDYLRRIIITFSILFLYGGLRTDCGDWDAYESFYNVASQYGASSALKFNEHMEYGWAFICQLFPSFRVLVIVQTLLFCVTLGYVTYKIVPSKYSWVVVLMLFITGDKSIMFMFCSMRNSIAVSLLLLSVAFMLKRKWKIAVFITIFASTIHTSAIVFIPIAGILSFWARKTVSMSKIELCIWITLLVSLVLFPIDSIIDPLVVVFMQDDLSRYQDIITAQHTSAGIAATFGSVLLSSGLLFYIYKYAETVEENTIGRISLLLTYSYLLGTLNVRVSHYYIIFFVLCMALIYKSAMPSILKRAYLGMALAFFGYALFVVEMNNEYCLFNIFQSFI